MQQFNSRLILVHRLPALLPVLPLTLLVMALLANVHSARVFPSLWQCPIQAAEMAAVSVELTCVLTHAMVDFTQVLHAVRSSSNTAAEYGFS
jgi:hypothetical protein